MLYVTSCTYAAGAGAGAVSTTFISPSPPAGLASSAPLAAQFSGQHLESPASAWHGQQSLFSGGCSWQCGDFSQTSAHLGLGQLDGRWHFQSHTGSSQTDSHSGSGFEHSVWQRGSLHTVSHSGHFPTSQCLTGHRTSHSGLLHLISHLEHPSS